MKRSPHLLVSCICLIVALASCATTNAVVAVAKTCAEKITNDLESAVFSALNAGSDTAFTAGMDKAVDDFKECPVGAEIDRVISTFTTAPVAGGTTVEVIKARKAELSASENSIVYQRAVAWRAAHPPAPVVAPAQ